ncbi:hypothetical protein M0805_007984 [Coniferiporia weirii]|nr:hypothetical protein M0805_007984 [Coniferiporia weirii]
MDSAVFMTNIGLTATEPLIIAKIAKVVHGPSYADLSGDGGSLLNFQVSLHRLGRNIQVPKSHLSLRTGTVTFPSEDVATRFLGDCGGETPRISIIVGYKSIKFRKSNKPARAEVVENIRRLPFVDPHVLQEKETVLQSIEGLSVFFSAIQFGWDCRDDVFSVEYERSSQWFACRFVPETREFRISLPGVQGSCRSETIVIHSSQIRAAYRDDDLGKLSFYFSLWHAPTFELVQDQSASLRSRLCSLGDDDHRRVVPYISFAVRLLCDSVSDYRDFIDLWKITQVHFPLSRSRYYVERRELFSSHILDELNKWLEQLEWPAAFHIDALVRNSITDPRELLSLRSDIQDMLLRRGKNYSAGFLRFLRVELQAPCYSAGSQSRESVQECFQRCTKEYKYESATAAPDDLFYCLHVIVTPTGLLLDGPFPERTNRVMRTYPDNSDCFLRVAFKDENRLQFRFDRRVDGRSFLNEHVGKILRGGLKVGGKRFDFLAYSQSALKDHAVWFVCPFFHTDSQSWVNAKTIIKSIGIFKDLGFDNRLLYCPARYAARISQAFTATDRSIIVEADEIFPGKDIIRNGSCFTDGVGTISPTLADEMWGALCAKKRRGFGLKVPHPRAFQIRFQGSKGMVSVDHTRKGRELMLRPSMIKFEDPTSRYIEIARAFNKPGKMFLNRPLVMLLEGLGVPVEVFVDLQRSAVNDVMKASETVAASACMLNTYGLGTSFRLSSILRHIAKLGCAPGDLFYANSLQSAVFHILRDFKHRARIPVPLGWTLVGVADIHSYLEENEVFVCIEEKKGERKYLEGPVCISRSPTVHPGDVQLAEAIGFPPAGSPLAKECLQNTVVFSTKGYRSLPSCLGGGDLDGDLYNVTTYSGILPKKTRKAALYDAAKRKELDRPSTIDDVIDFIVDYMNADNIGIIATNWLIVADQSEEIIFDPDCLKLAQLHSNAVDYPKTGNAVPMTEIPKLKFTARPDWSEPETSRRSEVEYYKSKRAIGELYRNIELPKFSTQLSVFSDANNAENQNLPSKGTVDIPRRDDALCCAIQLRTSQLLCAVEDSLGHLSRIEDVFWKYSEQLKYICFSHTMNQSRHSKLSEAEAFIGTIKAKTALPKRRKELISRLREQTTQLVADIRYELGDGDDVTGQERLALAYTAWQMSLTMMEKDKFGSRSFFWVALGLLFDAIRVVEEEEYIVQPAGILCSSV